MRDLEEEKFKNHVALDFMLLWACIIGIGLAFAWASWAISNLEDEVRDLKELHASHLSNDSS